MSDVTNPIKLATEQDLQLSPQQVREYLLANPDFFVRFPSIVEQLQIPHQTQGVVSLVELRSQQLQQRADHLQNKISQMLNMAKHNEHIYRLYAELNVRLFQCQSPAEMRAVLETSIVKEFDLAAVVLHLFDSDTPPNDDFYKLLQKRFSDARFFFGRMTQAENKLLFADTTPQSVALMSLGDRGELGVLAIASGEAGHFTPEMDTLLIAQLQQLLTLLVLRATQ